MARCQRAKVCRRPSVKTMLYDRSNHGRVCIAPRNERLGVREPLEVNLKPKVIIWRSWAGRSTEKVCHCRDMEGGMIGVPDVRYRGNVILACECEGRRKAVVVKTELRIGQIFDDGSMDRGKQFVVGFTDRSQSGEVECIVYAICLLYTSPSPRDGLLSRMPSSA